MTKIFPPVGEPKAKMGTARPPRKASRSFSFRWAEVIRKTTFISLQNRSLLSGSVHLPTQLSSSHNMLPQVGFHSGLMHMAIILLFSFGCHCLGARQMRGRRSTGIAYLDLDQGPLLVTIVTSNSLAYRQAVVHVCLAQPLGRIGLHSTRNTSRGFIVVRGPRVLREIAVRVFRSIKMHGPIVSRFVLGLCRHEIPSSTSVRGDEGISTGWAVTACMAPPELRFCPRRVL
ncbi:hypothetical protein DFJ74DRAFT_312745 [Hyaloraphidium curvatum]|nr:hypothetical protein DFJ74DRAFT_312745 [Hyaloraphidium curvatum]